MKKLLLSIAGALLLIPFSFAQEAEDQIIIKNRVNKVEKEQSPYVILISIDGFRYDYIEKHNAEFLATIAAKGVKAESMLPSYPSVTFPNHYSIVTGMYPAHHGLVGNNMYDKQIGERYSLRNATQVRNPQWYGGTPLWVLAENQGLLTACYYWPGSEAPIQDTFPTYYYKYSEQTAMDQRIESVVNWLNLPEEKRPHLITFYLPEVDHAGHGFGVDAIETKQAVQFVDKSIEKLVQEVAKTGVEVNYVIVSDHGMLDIDQQTILSLPIKVDPSELTIVSNGTYVSVFVNKKERIEYWYDQLKQNSNSELMKVFTKENLPAHYNFGGDNDRFDRVGDIVVTANPPYYFTNKAFPASHGFDPYEVKEMHALFLAIGPDFKKGLKINSFDNVHVYPVISKLLGLDITDDIDGDSRVADQVLE